MARFIFLTLSFIYYASIAFCQTNSIGEKRFYGASVNNSTITNRKRLMSNANLETIAIKDILRRNKINTGYLYAGRSGKEVLLNKYAIDSSTILSTFGNADISTTSFIWKI